MKARGMLPSSDSRLDDAIKGKVKETIRPLSLISSLVRDAVVRLYYGKTRLRRTVNTNCLMLKTPLFLSHTLPLSYFFSFSCSFFLVYIRQCNVESTIGSRLHETKQYIGRNKSRARLQPLAIADRTAKMARK